MIRHILIGLAIALYLSAGPVFAGPKVVAMGDGVIDGTKIRPYEHTWRQCSISEGGWVDGGTLTERMTEASENGQNYLVHEQDTLRPDGGRSLSETYLVRNTLAPAHIEVHVYDAEANEVGAARYEFNQSGYSGYKARGEQRQSVSGKLNSGMYNGMAFGLPLATLDSDTQLPVELSAFMVSFDASYRVIATKAGSEKLKIGDQTVTASLVDVEWHHNESGDVYPAGPDASGGRYWIVSNPPPGVPYVPRYKTDTYAIEIVPSVCPEG